MTMRFREMFERFKTKSLFYAISFATRRPWIIKLLLPFRDRLMGLLFNKRREPISENGKSDRWNDVDVVLVQAPAWGINTPPFAAASLAAYLRGNGFKVLPLDLNIALYRTNNANYGRMWRLEESDFWNNRPQVENFIKANRPVIDSYVDNIVMSGAKVVGFTIYSTSYLMSSYIAGMIKKRNDRVLIIFGGPDVSRNMRGPEILAADNNVDYIVDGEGEETLLEIAGRSRAGETVSGCKGTLYRNSGKVEAGGERELVKSLDSLPFPDFSDFDFSLYNEPFQIPIASSRGCVNRCIYCNDIAFWKRFRYRSGESLFDEIRRQSARHPNVFFFEFHDSLVNGSIRELEKMCDAIIGSGIKIKWSAQAVMRKEMTYDFFVKLRRSGCVNLTYGIESTSKQLVVKIGKALAMNADIERIIRDSYKAGVCSTLNFMFGLPGETEEEFEETLHFIRRNGKYITSLNPSQSYCVFNIGTKVHACPSAYGVDLTKGSMYWESLDKTNNYIVRMNRFERFVSLAYELKISSTYPYGRLLDKKEKVGDYYLHIGEFDKAISYYKESLADEGDNPAKRVKLELCIGRAGRA